MSKFKEKHLIAVMRRQSVASAMRNSNSSMSLENLYELEDRTLIKSGLPAEVRDFLTKLKERSPAAASNLGTRWSL